MSPTASRYSIAPADEPGVLRMRPRPTTPARGLDSRPGGFANRIASARPGASRSNTNNDASGVRSRGEKPVPPVVTTRPEKSCVNARSAEATDSTPSGTTRRSTIEKPARSKCWAINTPDSSSLRPACTESETVRILAAQSHSRSVDEGPRSPSPRGDTTAWNDAGANLSLSDSSSVVAEATQCRRKRPRDKVTPSAD